MTWRKIISRVNDVVDRAYERLDVIENDVNRRGDSSSYGSLVDVVEELGDALEESSLAYEIMVDPYFSILFPDFQSSNERTD